MRILNKQYRQYYAKAQTVQSVHSPFLYKLFSESIENDKQYNMLIDLEIFERNSPIAFKISLNHLSFIFHWLRICKPKVVYLNEHTPYELPWMIKRMNIRVKSIENDELSSESFAIIVYDHADSIAQFLKVDAPNLFLVCIGTYKSNYDELAEVFDLTVNMYDVHLLINRPDTKAKQHFTIIEKKKKLTDVGLFPKKK